MATGRAAGGTTTALATRTPRTATVSSSVGKATVHLSVSGSPEEVTTIGDAVSSSLAAAAMPHTAASTTSTARQRAMVEALQSVGVVPTHATRAW